MGLSADTLTNINSSLFQAVPDWRDQMTAFNGRREFIILIGGAAGRGRLRQGPSTDRAWGRQRSLMCPQGITAQIRS